MILFAGLVVLIANIRPGLDEHFHENAILRALGARRKVIMGSLLIEFSLLSLIAGILALLRAEVTLYMLQTRIFLIGITCTLFSYRIVKPAPVTILRELA